MVSKKLSTTIRCVPRFGFRDTEVRTIEVDAPRGADDADLHASLAQWFQLRGIADAVYDIAADNDGLFAIINDEAYEEDWGTPLL